MSNSMSSVLVELLKEQADLIHRQIARLQQLEGGNASSASSSGAEPKKQTKAEIKAEAKAAAEAGKKKKEPVDPNRPKRPPTGYQLFMAEITPKVKEGNPGISQTDLMSNVAKLWSNLDENKKKPYQTEAEKVRVQYVARMKTYEESRGSSASTATPVVSVSSAAAAPGSPKPKAKKPVAVAATPAPAVVAPVAVVASPAATTASSAVEPSTDKKDKKHKKHHHEGDEGEKKKKHKKDKADA